MRQQQFADQARKRRLIRIRRSERRMIDRTKLAGYRKDRPDKYDGLSCEEEESDYGNESRFH